MVLKPGQVTIVWDEMQLTQELTKHLMAEPLHLEPEHLLIPLLLVAVLVHLALTTKEYLQETQPLKFL